MALFDTLTRTQIARLHGVRPQSVSRWVKQGMPRNPDNTYSGRATIEWRMRRKPCRTCGHWP